MSQQMESAERPKGSGPRRYVVARVRRNQSMSVERVSEIGAGSICPNGVTIILDWGETGQETSTKHRGEIEDALDVGQEIISKLWPQICKAGPDQAVDLLPWGWFPGVWNAVDYTGNVLGYLVTDPASIDRPIALIKNEGESQDFAFVVAKQIAVDHRLLTCPEAPSARWIDLRPYGKPESRERMPGFIYSLQCRPVFTSGDVANGVKYVEPNPWCPIREAEMNAARPPSPVDPAARKKKAARQKKPSAPTRGSKKGEQAHVRTAA